ncbi:alpha/beta hydrolase [Aliarcobacter cryaerophilus]|uniref:alpha/beta hydrolase n=1 Tax=Aliarcobacter cryaerophilus TaxID=28198 RepID=UPI0021B56A45|nr:alpha/beta hydrolase [Aliarcobacter cryaerophilus]MCT7492880.1 alpha/beta hydrolase [Aliarcobacter cryaerophilus]
MKTYIFVFMVVLFFSGCSSKIPTLEDRKNIAQSLINDKSVVQKDIKTDNFTLFSFQKVSNECKNSIKIYIEGDGLSWVSKNIVSSNPTPINPIALKLMLLDDSSCKIYLARPCQYTSSNICEEKYWTSHRFNSKIIDSFNEALDSLKKEYSNHNFNLLGYSGGGAIVTLLASQREDISSLTTIAGNLDIEKWTNIQKISPLNGSLNPADFSNTLENIKQHHLIGEDDKIIPKEIFFSYQNRFKNKEFITYSIEKATHNCCWEEIYKDYLLKNKN